MGTWAAASLLTIAGLLLLEVETTPQIFQNQGFSGFFNHPNSGRPAESEGVAKLHSALGLQPQVILPRYDDLYKNFDEHFHKNLEKTGPQTFPLQNADARNDALAKTHDYDDYKTSQTTNILGPHQIETIQSEHFHKEIPVYDVSEYHHTSEKHGEVHYHQHKHIHKHEHKQEHVHQHKQDHQHKHLHSQQHKHDHHSNHKHAHEHKHQHHQEHKHNHEHKHENHHDHKHQHGHKHKHHSDNKHQHHHGHKHGHDHHHKHHHTKHH